MRAEQAIRQALDQGWSRIPEYLSQEAAGEISKELLGVDFADPKAYSAGKIEYFHQRSDASALEKSPRLCEVVTELTTAIQSVLPDWQATNVDVRWQRDEAHGWHQDQEALKDVLAILTLHGRARLDLGRESGSVDHHFMAGPGDVLFLREHGQDSPPLYHRVHQPEGDGLRIIALAANSPEGL